MEKNDANNDFDAPDLQSCEESDALQSPSRTFQPLAIYLRFLDHAKIFVVVLMAICGFVFLVLAHRADYIRNVLGEEPPKWIWLINVFGFGIVICLAAAILFIVEYLARLSLPQFFVLKLFLVRFFAILIAAAALFYLLFFYYGVTQGIGAVTSLFLILATIHECGTRRRLLGTLAVIIICVTFWGTRTTYQYARHHAAEIVSAGNSLRESLGSTSEGREISIDDSRIPEILRKLGARRIWIDNNRVAVYVGGETEFQIYNSSDSKEYCSSIWGLSGKGGPIEITDQLWMSDS